MAHEPGTHFLYNTGATYMLSAIVQQITGQTLLEYLRPRLFEPLGIEGATWESCPRGINTGGFGLSIKTEDIARFGQLYLQRGVWQGPAARARSVGSAKPSADQVSNATNTEGTGSRATAISSGAAGTTPTAAMAPSANSASIMPEQDAVLAITGGTPNMQAVLNLVWTHLLPALGPAALSEDRPAQTVLAQRLANLALPPVAGSASSALAGQVSGRRYEFIGKRSPLQALTFDFGGDVDRCTVRDADGETRDRLWARLLGQGDHRLEFHAATGPNTGRASSRRCQRRLDGRGHL